MRLPFQILALAGWLGVMWIAFAHHFPSPAPWAASISGPLLALAVSAVGLGVVYRSSLLAALDRSALGAPSDSDERVTRALVAGLVVTGFLLRIAATGEYGLNPDEAQLVWLAAAPTLSEVWAYETLASPHPPGIFFVLHYMQQISWDLWWLRLPAVLGGTFSIWMSYRLARELLGAPAGILVAFMVTLSPPLVELSRVARNYAPGFAFVTASLFFFVRFMKTRNWWHFVAFSACASVAMTWHYVFIVLYVGLQGVIAIEFLRARERIGSWLRAGVFQVPFAAVVGTLYVTHIAVLPGRVEGRHEHWYQAMLAFDPSAPLRPFQELWGLLAPGGTQLGLALASVAGIAVLAARRQWLALGVCTLPLAAAAGFAWSGRVPLGATRHSAYLFPLAFMLVAANLPELRTGYRDLRAWLMRIARARRPEPAPVGTAAAWLLLSAAGLTAIAFASSSLLDYAEESRLNPLRAQSYHGHELVHRYRQADVERTFELLEKYAGPDDWVMLDFSSAYELRIRLRLPPVVFRNPADRLQRDIAIVKSGPGPQRRVHNGIQYYYSKVFNPFPKSLPEILMQVRDVRRYFDLEPPPKVWLIGSGWLQPQAIRFRVKAPLEGVDWRALYETQGLLLGVETDLLRALFRESPVDARVSDKRFRRSKPRPQKKR